MDTKFCRHCGTAFEPLRNTQKYCSPVCSRRHRDSAWKERHQVDSGPTLKAQLAVIVAEDRASLEAARAQWQRELMEARLTARGQLEVQTHRHEMEMERLHTRLRDLASVNIDIACEMPELKAQVTQLQLENARLIHSWRADSQELMQIAGRLFELSSRLGLPLDKTTKEIFQRRGWRTNTLVPEQ